MKIQTDLHLTRMRISLQLKLHIYLVVVQLKLWEQYVLKETQQLTMAKLIQYLLLLDLLAIMHIAQPYVDFVFSITLRWQRGLLKRNITSVKLWYLIGIFMLVMEQQTFSTTMKLFFIYQSIDSIWESSSQVQKENMKWLVSVRVKVSTFSFHLTFQKLIHKTLTKITISMIMITFMSVSSFSFLLSENLHLIW